MKPFDDLTYHGRIRRMRQLAQAALNAYGLPVHFLPFRL
jgi:hypothetical protein